MGYSLVEITESLFQFFFAKNILIYIHIPDTMLVRHVETQIFFMGTDLNDLKKVMASFLLIRKHTIYELSGIFFAGQIITLKPGKIKIR